MEQSSNPEWWHSPWFKSRAGAKPSGRYSRVNDMEPIKPIEICIGNFIESMGNIEMVTGIMKQDGDFWQIAHCGWHKGKSPLPPDMLINTYPIPLTDEWKKCFGIDKYELPEWIKYVHQVQNHFMWALQVNLLDIMDWNLLPSATVIDLDAE